MGYSAQFSGGVLFQPFGQPMIEPRQDERCAEAFRDLGFELHYPKSASSAVAIEFLACASRAADVGHLNEGGFWIESDPFGAEICTKSFKANVFVRPSSSTLTSGQLNYRMEAFLKLVRGLLLSLRGYITLHGNGVRVRSGKLALIVGASGAGKSTFSGFVAKEGGDLICDDLCAIDAQTLELVPSDPWLNLDRATLNFLGVEPPDGEATALAKWVVPVNPRPLAAGAAMTAGAKPSAAAQPFETSVIVELRQLGPNERVKIQQLSLGDALFSLMANDLFPGFSLQSNGANFVSSRLSLAKRIPVLALYVPRQFDALHSALTALEQALSRP